MKLFHLLSKLRVFRVGILLLLVGILTGCSQSGITLSNRENIDFTAIEELQQSERGDKIIYLRGKVSSRASFLDSGAYYLQDTTGQIWVLTEESLPQEGDKVVVQGEVKYQSIPIGAGEKEDAGTRGRADAGSCGTHRSPHGDLKGSREP
ncbi:MAG: hypothetical protein BRC40_01290 [Cyanobacteria bacterium QH_8_48_120]|nr:MAG: hypothetical protein BRC40_01290 [Cyanobacteria bacterium QH_8_48_120]